jgi:hypothetical protein
VKQAAAMFAVLLGTGLPALAQTLPAGPVRAFDGRLTVAGEVVATLGSQDDITFFNYTDYERNALRLLRLGVSGAWRPWDRVELVGEVRSEDLEHVTPYAAFVRVRPWASRGIDIQAGRIPLTFGAFGRRPYGTDSAVVGYPLAYQYLTSLRPDAVPETGDDLLRMRARGWRSSFPVGDYYEGPGVPLVSGLRWDTGVQVQWTTDLLAVSGAVTTGTLSNPRVSDDNDGKQISGRVAVTPVVGLILGASAARGAWLSEEVPQVQAGRSYAQTAFGADAEYSRDYWIVRGEIVWTRWGLPYPAATSDGRHVSATGAWVEGRYRLTPRVFVSGRADRLSFSSIRGDASSSVETPWDAPVRRLEAAAGYYLQRNLVGRLGVQGNWRDAGRVRHRTYVTAQLTYWF